MSWARVNEARTSSGFDWSGIRPDRRVTIRGSSRGGTSSTSVSSVSIGLPQDAQRILPLNAAGTGTADATWGSRASCGSGWPLYTMTS